MCNVYTRWGDKTTYYMLCGLLVFCFISSGILFYYEILSTNEFWSESAICIAKQDFECLLEVRSDQTITKDMTLSVVGAALSIQGLFVGMTIMLLYKGHKRIEYRDRVTGGEKDGESKLKQ